MADKVTGLETVLANLNREIVAIEQRTLAGLMAAGLHLQRKSMEAVPVEYGNLRASAYTRKSGDLSVEVGYHAAYAVYVHENLEQRLRGQPRPSKLGTYWNPGGPKFLERPMREESDVLLKIVADTARIGVRSG